MSSWHSAITIKCIMEAIRIKDADRGIYVEDHRLQGNINISLTTEKYQATRRLQTARAY